MNSYASFQTLLRHLFLVEAFLDPPLFPLTPTFKLRLRGEAVGITVTTRFSIKIKHYSFRCPGAPGPGPDTGDIQVSKTKGLTLRSVLSQEVVIETVPSRVMCASDPTGVGGGGGNYQERLPR